ncbi:MAG: ABC-F family ATP-binding cassette domain-containing protein [Lachnospiraceae bacterium]|nr:ABC-F family ATP-binding cassette domain-containing protein [Lachnospiraceae bacterium]
MNLITIKNLTKAYTDKVLFDGIDFSLEEGEKVGVVGINGTGKSTLLKIIAGIEEADSGEYTKKNNLVINYLPQVPEFDSDMSIYDYVINANGKSDSHWDIEGDAKAMLNKLGFEDYSIKLSTLSGGQKKKVALAGALLSDSEILILDEPTNHLDNMMTEWLEEWLKGYKGALIMITHDRYFLDLVCNRIVELDKSKLYSYKENYEGFLLLKAEREAMALSTQKKHENILRKEIAWIQRGARARSTKQKAHIARYEALRDEEKVQIDNVATIEALSSRLGKKTIELKNISKSYGDRTLINDFTYTFLRTDRIGILGPNGCGKSTLMKMIIGEVAPDKGSIEIGDTVKIGYYSQECESMNPKEKVIDYIKDTAEYIKTDDGYISASQMLEKFLFEGSLQYQLIEKLSGGERRRLYLAKVLMEAPNVLILDEPTNDLDLTTLRILEDFLDTFQGILIAVSHDRYFLDRVSARMLTFDGFGNIDLFNGSYTEYYQKFKEEHAGDASSKPGKLTDSAQGQSSKVSSDSPLSGDLSSGAQAYKEQKAQNQKLKFTYKEQKEYETIEADIEALEEKISKLESELSNPKISSDFVKLNELTKEKEETERLYEEKMERYLYLEDLAQEIENQKKGL